MINICHHCGEYRADKSIDLSGPYAVCPECGHRHSILQLPLCIVGGASGSGKSCVYNKLMGRMDEVILLEGDILWRSEFDKPKEKYRDFFETWLWIIKNISQSGRPVVIFNAGMVVPENVESCVERRYFSKVYYLALVCGEDELVKRLSLRPTWRKSSDPEFIVRNVAFNHWLKENAASNSPSIDLLDTTEDTIEETAIKSREMDLGESRRL